MDHHTDELEQFENQLVQVESLLQLEPNDQLLELKKDLEEAIEIIRNKQSEESNDLSASNDGQVETMQSVCVQNGSSENQQQNQPKPSQSTSDDDHLSDYNQLIGESYRVPFVTSNCKIEMHEAEIIKVVEIDEEDGDVKLDVKFLYPLDESMLFCSKCKSDNELPNCPFSHGYTVHLSMIKCTLDSDDLKVDSICLFKQANNQFWSKGTIVDKKSNLFFVRMPESSQELISLEEENIRPFGFQDVEDDDDDDDIIEIEEINEVVFLEQKQKEIALIEISDDEADNQNGTFTNGFSASKKDSLRFDAWQDHSSSGFGVKMLKKLGYVPGKGLGIRGQGIVNPIQLNVVPNNTSLDACMELREKGLLSSSLEKFSHTKQKNYFKNLILKKNQKSLKKGRKDQSDDGGASGLFNTLNQNLATKSNPKKPSSAYSKLKMIQKESKNVDNVHANIFKIESEIERVKNDILHIKKSINLCREINPANLKQLNENLMAKSNELHTNELRLKVLKERSKKNKYDHNVKYF